jgi:hypothetical protein
VEEGPIPAIHGVVRWRACDLIMRLYDDDRVAELTLLSVVDAEAATLCCQREREPI